jgi:hypothetical protein
VLCIATVPKFNSQWHRPTAKQHEQIKEKLNSPGNLVMVDKEVNRAVRALASYMILSLMNYNRKDEPQQVR